jgi:hypothetical protein
VSRWSPSSCMSSHTHELVGNHTREGRLYVSPTTRQEELRSSPHRYTYFLLSRRRSLNAPSHIPSTSSLVIEGSLSSQHEVQVQAYNRRRRGGRRDIRGGADCQDQVSAGCSCTRQSFGHYYFLPSQAQTSSWSEGCSFHHAKSTPNCTKAHTRTETKAETGAKVGADRSSRRRSVEGRLWHGLRRTFGAKAPTQESFTSRIRICCPPRHALGAERAGRTSSPGPAHAFHSHATCTFDCKTHLDLIRRRLRCVRRGRLGRSWCRPGYPARPSPRASTGATRAYTR